MADGAVVTVEVGGGGRPAARADRPGHQLPGLLPYGKDRSDLRSIAESDVFDVVALSFVGDSSDISETGERLSASAREARIIAKLETQAGIDNVESICAAADLVMAARGDLALSLPWVGLPGAVAGSNGPRRRRRALDPGHADRQGTGLRSARHGLRLDGVSSWLRAGRRSESRECAPLLDAGRLAGSGASSSLGHVHGRRARAA
ncbi:pyruvate kinase [Herbidospora sp. RD11066]